jgi:glycosyltransferase involved in cell wall biosynthesis
MLASSTFRICRVTHALYPDYIGGHAIFCHELSERQAKAGHRVEVFTARSRHLPKRQSVIRGYGITRFDRVWMPWDSLGMYNPVTPAMYQAVARPEWDLVDAHSQLFLTSALAVMAAAQTGKPVITTVHGFLALRDWFTNLAQKAYLRSVGLWALKNSNRVICLTRADADEAANLGVKRQCIRVIPPAVESSKYTKGGVSRISILWVGRLVKEKGLRTLVSALSKMPKLSNLRVLLVGDGPERNRLISSSRQSNLAGVIALKSHANREEVGRLLSEAEVFVLPSLKEGLPLALLEAMASSKIVVASDLFTVREVLGDAGLYFAPGNPGELADKLEQALGDAQLRREKGRLAREIVEEHFSWDIVLPRLDDLYSEVVHE